MQVRISSSSASSSSASISVRAYCRYDISAWASTILCELGADRSTRGLGADDDVSGAHRIVVDTVIGGRKQCNVLKYINCISVYI